MEKIGKVLIMASFLCTLTFGFCPDNNTKAWGKTHAASTIVFAIGGFIYLASGNKEE